MKRFLLTTLLFLTPLFAYADSNTQKVYLNEAINIALKNNNKVIGICPNSYKHDFDNLKCTEEILANSINDRTNKVIDECDAIVFLPGGIGSIYEFFVSLECKRNHEFDKPIVIYNSNGFFNKLLDFMEVIYNEGFAYSKDKELYFVSDNIADILEYLNNK